MAYYHAHTAMHDLPCALPCCAMQNACLGSNGGNAGTGCKFTDVTVLSQQGCPDMPPNGLKASAEATSTITFNSDCVTKDTPGKWRTWRAVRVRGVRWHSLVRAYC